MFSVCDLKVILCCVNGNARLWAAELLILDVCLRVCVFESDRNQKIDNSDAKNVKIERKGKKGGEKTHNQRQ